MRRSELPSRSVALLLVGIGLFGAAMALRHRLDPWWTNAAIAATIGATSLVVLARSAPSRFSIHPGPLAAAAVLGIGLVALTHLAYGAMVALDPSLAGRVADLYANISGAPRLPITAALIILIVATEELLWRGVALELLDRRVSRRAAGAIAIALYTLPQIAGGSLLLIAAALALGSVLTVQRLICGRLAEPFVTHAIWSVSIFGFTPLI